MQLVPAWAATNLLATLAHRDLGGKWSDRRWMNMPGPLYTGQADFACIGPGAAPGFVGMDDEHVVGRLC